jgi:hypothetical protein
VRLQIYSASVGENIKDFDNINMQGTTMKKTKHTFHIDIYCLRASSKKPGSAKQVIDDLNNTAQKWDLSAGWLEQSTSTKL